MAAPFPEAQFEALIYILLGMLLALVIMAGIYIRRLHRKIENGVTAENSNKPDLRVDNIGLTKKSEDLMEQILEEPELQSDLPGILSVSKATVSNAVSELKERGLIKRKKKANTYLIEPDIEQLEKEQR